MPEQVPPEQNLRAAETQENNKPPGVQTTRLFMLGIALSAIVITGLFLLPQLLDQPVTWFTVIGLIALAAAAYVGFGLAVTFRPGMSKSPAEARSLRLIGALLFVVIGLTGLYSYYRHSMATFVANDLSVELIFFFANSTLSTLLIAWLSFRATLMLLKGGRLSAGFAARVTRSLAGLALVVVGVHHLYLAARMGIDQSGFNVSISTSGFYLAGFTGWYIIDAAVAAGGVAFLIGNTRIVRMAAWALCGLFALVCPLAISKVMAVEVPVGLSVTAVAALLPLVVAYLFFWYQRELGMQYSPGANSSGGR